MISPEESAKSTEPLPSYPESDETVSRYILEKKKFSRANGYVKARALEPSRKSNQTSVFRISGLIEESVWRLGREYVSEPQGKSLLARADILVHVIRENQLEVAPDEPPIRHANIVGWPTQKDAMMAKAQLLAANASLVINEGA